MHLQGLDTVKNCCKNLDNLVPEEPENPAPGLTMVRCRVCRSRHFNQKVDPSTMKALPTP